MVILGIFNDFFELIVKSRTTSKVFNLTSDQQLDGWNLDRVEWSNDDTKHTSELGLIWIRQANIKLLQWPSQSPNLHSIEHL